MLKTPISDAAMVNSEPHGFEVVPYHTARALEIEVAPLTAALQNALVIIVGEYPKSDERYIWAWETAKKFNLDLGEMG